MEWNNKIELAKLLNEGKYKKAVELMAAESEWDSQCVVMFVTGFDLTKYELCVPIKDRVLNYDLSHLGFREQMRMAMLQIELEKYINTIK